MQGAPGSEGKRPSLLAQKRTPRRSYAPGRFLSDIRQEHSVITGLHQVYGRIWRDSGLDRTLPSWPCRTGHEGLFHTAIARLANPESKRALACLMQQSFGTEIARDTTCRITDCLHDAHSPDCPALGMQCDF